MTSPSPLVSLSKNFLKKFYIFTHPLPFYFCKRFLSLEALRIWYSQPSTIYMYTNTQITTTGAHREGVSSNKKPRKHWTTMFSFQTFQTRREITYRLETYLTQTLHTQIQQIAYQSLKTQKKKSCLTQIWPNCQFGIACLLPLGHLKKSKELRITQDPKCRSLLYPY